MNTSLPCGFFAYPSAPPRISETISQAVNHINSGASVRLKTWQDMRSGGKILISEICKEIDDAQLFCADLTNLNPNVMFELGYAIMRQKRIWPILDSTILTPSNDFKSFVTLTSIGYTEYTNSRHIVNKFYEEHPYDDLAETIYQRNIEPLLSSNNKPSILYLKSKYEDDFSIFLSRKLDQIKIDKIVSDPREVALRELSWYGSNIHNASAIICHLSNPERKGAALDNAIYTLVAGMAHAIGKPLKMFIESNDDYLAPLDVRHILHRYHKAATAQIYLAQWLEPFEVEWAKHQYVRDLIQHERKLASELKELRFGDPLGVHPLAETTS